MNKKIEIKTVNSFSVFTKYTIDNPSIDIFVFDQSTNQDLYQLTQVNTLTQALYQDQFAVDMDRGLIYLASNIIGKTIKIIYYSYNSINPYSAMGNLNQFITRIMEWSDNRISNGLYFYSSEYDPDYIRRCAHGAFIYNGQFFIYKGEIFDFRIYAPPTIENMFRGYYFFFNTTSITSYLDRQNNVISKIGMLRSDGVYETMAECKTDLESQYWRLYDEEPINVAFVYLMVNNHNYEFWTQYPPEVRVL